MRSRSCKLPKHVSNALDFWELLTCFKVHKCLGAGRSQTCTGIEQAFKRGENCPVNKLLVNSFSRFKQNNSREKSTEENVHLEPSLAEPPSSFPSQGIPGRLPMHEWALHAKQNHPLIFPITSVTKSTRLELCHISVSK